MFVSKKYLLLFDEIFSRATLAFSAYSYFFSVIDMKESKKSNWMLLQIWFIWCCFTHRITFFFVCIYAFLFFAHSIKGGLLIPGTLHTSLCYSKECAAIYS